jgi:hypothetical protein
VNSGLPIVRIWKGSIFPILSQETALWGKPEKDRLRIVAINETKK